MGLQAGFTGAARTPTSIAWASQYANAWTGTVSSGKNLAHADCNRDGIVNSGDNGAISANFTLTHSFKESQKFGTPDIKIIPQATVAYAGIWNKADIFLGDATNNINNIYGIAFNINYTQNVVQQDSSKIIYTPSFLNS